MSVTSVKISPVTPTPHTMRTRKAAGQEPFAAGSRIATHSTLCVIEKVSRCAEVGERAGQGRFCGPGNRLSRARSVERASRPRRAGLPTRNFEGWVTNESSALTDKYLPPDHRSSVGADG